MYPETCLLRDNLTTAHAESWRQIGQPGAFLTAAERVEAVRASRDALTCEFCAERKAALSPNAVQGEHDSSGQLPPPVVDMIHRLRTDPGRLTRAWFDQVTAVISRERYVELVGVVTSAVIIDTLHNALGLGLPELPVPQPGEPSGQANPDAVDGGAWVPILAADEKMADTGLPMVPNIARSLGLVPSALGLFFNTFRPHYALKDIALSISQGQAEFVAARVSAINECFY